MYGHYDQRSAEISRSQTGQSSDRIGAVPSNQHYVEGSAYSYGSNLGQSAGSVGSFSSGPRRQGQHRKQVIRLPDQPVSQPRQVRVRLPTPEPDTLERVYVQRAANEIVEEIIEVPSTPPPRVQERTIIEPPPAPVIVRRTIRVQPRMRTYAAQPQYTPPATSNYTGYSMPYSAPIVSQGSYNTGYGPYFGGFQAQQGYYY